MAPFGSEGGDAVSRCFDVIGCGHHLAYDFSLHRSRKTPMGKYSDTMMDHVLSPRNGGMMENPDLAGHAGTPAGERS